MDGPVAAAAANEKKLQVRWTAREAILQNISHRFNLWINYCTSNKAAAQMTKHPPWRAGRACVELAAVCVLLSFSRSTVLRPRIIVFHFGADPVRMEMK